VNLFSIFKYWHGGAK